MLRYAAAGMTYLPEQGRIMTRTASRSTFTWPGPDYSRIPYWVYTSDELFHQEQEKIFRGPTWVYVGLECEVPTPGDYKSTYIGAIPVVLTRSAENSLHAFVNRCAHRGSAVVRDLRGNAKVHRCIYHQWCYNPKGELMAVPLEKGMNGQGGFPQDFKKENHGLERLRVDAVRGMVFASFSAEAPPLREYLGDLVVERLEKIFNRPVRVTGYNRTTTRCNWKYAVENTRDQYHGPLLHKFIPTFGFAQFGKKAKGETDKRRMHSIISNFVDLDNPPAPSTGKLRLEEPAVARGKPDFDDGMILSVISIFPATLVTIVGNTFSIRQFHSKTTGTVETPYTLFGYADDDADKMRTRRLQNNLVGPAGYISMEDAEALEIAQSNVQHLAKGAAAVVELEGRDVLEQSTMMSENPIRGFWKAYCEMMGIEVPSSHPERSTASFHHGRCKG